MFWKSVRFFWKLLLLSIITLSVPIAIEMLFPFLFIAGHPYGGTCISFVAMLCIVPSFFLGMRYLYPHIPFKTLKSSKEIYAVFLMGAVCVDCIFDPAFFVGISVSISIRIVLSISVLCTIMLLVFPELLSQFWYDVYCFAGRLIIAYVAVGFVWQLIHILSKLCIGEWDPTVLHYFFLSGIVPYAWLVYKMEQESPSFARDYTDTTAMEKDNPFIMYLWKKTARRTNSSDLSKQKNQAP